MPPEAGEKGSGVNGSRLGLGGVPFSFYLATSHDSSGSGAVSPRERLASRSSRDSVENRRRVRVELATSRRCLFRTGDTTAATVQQNVRGSNGRRLVLLVASLR
jgi:hypothetical protein